jgi:putative hydrolase of the HAD superfamily
MEMVKVIGFDADDTLWVNGLYFHEAELAFCKLLSNYMKPNELTGVLYQTEMKNMALYGYGAMAYTLSLMETAIMVSKEKVPASVIQEILDIGRFILDHPVEVYPGVKEVLPELQRHYTLIVVTKGDLLDQERKLEKSGLLPFFHHIEIVSEKHVSNYLKLMEVLGIHPSEFLMVGNSLKSDIIPVLSIGGKAVHIPRQEVWQHENSVKPTEPYVEIPSMADLASLLPF